MRGLVFSFIELAVLVVLIITFLVAVGVGVFTFYRPQIVISMIEQLVPSVTPIPRHVSIKGVAVLGDSQSDEYRGDDNRGQNYPSSTLGWVEILQQKRHINFGEWGAWDEPRRDGYEYNWARTGATAYSLLMSGQHVGVAEQIKSGKVNVVIVYIGANDFAPFITHDGYEAIYNDTLSDATLLLKVNRVVADIKTALDTVSAAGDVEVILVKIPDWGNHIGVKVAFPFPNQRERVTKAIDLANRELEVVARERGIPTIDPNVFHRNLLRRDDGRVVVGDVALEVLMLNNDPRNIFLEDGVHTGTVFNGLFANHVVRELNRAWGMNVRLLSDEEILSAAGIR
jgi:hypothetical protein